MRRSLGALSLLLALLLIPAARGDTIVLPTEMCRGYFFLPVTLSAREGYPQDRTLWFLHDTGASNTWIDPESLERVTGRRYEAGQRVTIADAMAGPVSFNRLGAAVKDLDHLSLALGREIDGLMAFSAFEDFLLTLDYQAGELRLSRGTLPPPDGETVFSASGRDDRAWLQIEIGGDREKVLVDSGAAGAAIKLERIDRFDTHATPRLTHSTTGIRSVTRHRSARLDGEAQIGPGLFVHPRLEETDGTELIGGEVMRHFVWTFDQQRERVRIVPASQGPYTMEPMRTHGLAILGREGGWEVFDVLPDTPAERAGFRIGDFVTHLGGVPVGERGCGQIASIEGIFPVTLVRDGQQIELPLEVEVLVE